MIRINLLEAGAKRARAAKTPEAFSASGTSSAALAGVGMLILAVVLLVGHNFYLQHQASVLAVQTAAAQQEASRLQAVRREFQQTVQRRQLLQQRIQMINTLKQNQSGPSSLLAALRQGVDGAPAVWLDSVGEKAGVLTIHGSALDFDAVANLMTSLRNTGYFTQVSLASSAQQTVKRGVWPFAFVLTAHINAPNPGPAANKS
ncbi:MAG: PilN domain-containing protein [Terriglobales bacterium]